MIKRLRSRHKKWIPVAAVCLLALLLLAVLAKTTRAQSAIASDWTLEQVQAWV